MQSTARQQLILVLLLALLCLVPAKAQSPPVNTLFNQVSIASPTAASLGKYTDIPVNYHTGIPQISVPLYTMKEGSLTLPLSLSYHAGGIKVLEPASWVGAGWALNAGGVITRSVMGGVDEVGITNQRFGHFTNYGYSSYFTIDAQPVPDRTGPSPASYQFTNGLYDGEPDLFFFNFNGYNGSFFFSDDRTPVLVNGDDLKIEYYYPKESEPDKLNVSTYIEGFIITVPTGDKYYFGSTDASVIEGAKPVELTFPYSEDHQTVTDLAPSSYYLHKIVAADGVHAIRFIYQQEKYSYYTLSTFPIVANTPKDNPITNYSEFRLVKNNIDGVRLATIKFSTGEVQLNPTASARTDLSNYSGGIREVVNTEAKALDNLTVSSLGFCKKWRFSYSYFQGDNTALATGLWNRDIETDKTRLKLDAVVEESCDGSAVAPPWKFSYYSSFLPRRLSFAQDHWGYYNGQDRNNALNTLIPTYSTNPLVPAQTPNTGLSDIVPGANRESAWPAMANGTLTKITYPTGGASSFEFEPNTVWVSYLKYQETEVARITAGEGTGLRLDPPSIPIDFTANSYRFVLRLESSTSSPSDVGNAMVYSSNPNSGISLVVNENRQWSNLG